MMKLNENHKIIYPTIFPIKVFIQNNPEALSHIHTTTELHMAITEDTITTNPSKGNKFLCLSIEFMAHSDDHLELFHKDLKKNKSVLMVL